jgi:hypothetical protein
MWQMLGGGTEIIYTQRCIPSRSRDIEKVSTQEIHLLLLRQQVIITLARQFWISAQSISHHIILTSDVRDFRHLKLTKDSKPSLTDSRKIWLTKNPSKAAVVRAYRERNTQELIPKMQTTVTKANQLSIISAIAFLSRR